MYLKIIAILLFFIPISLYVIAVKEANAPDPCNGVGNYNWYLKTCTDTSDGSSFYEKHIPISWAGYLAFLSSSFLLFKDNLVLALIHQLNVRSVFKAKTVCTTIWNVWFPYFVLLPLTYDGFDWHSESYLFALIFGGFISFPFGPVLLLMVLLLFKYIPYNASPYPIYPSDFTYGVFSVELSIILFVFSISAYMQWSVVLRIWRIFAEREIYKMA